MSRFTEEKNCEDAMYYCSKAQYKTFKFKPIQMPNTIYKKIYPHNAFDVSWYRKNDEYSNTL